MAQNVWTPAADIFHKENFPYHQGRKLMITPHKPPEPFANPHHYHPSNDSPPRDFDAQAVVDERKTRSQLVLETLPRGTIWPTNDGTKSSQHIGLTIEKELSTSMEGGAQVVLCKLNPGQKVKGIPPRVVVKIYDALYYAFMRDYRCRPADVVNQADKELSVEAAAYNQFKAVGKDGYYAPKFYGTFTTPIHSNIANKFRPVCLILLEYIDGFTMGSLCSSVHPEGGRPFVPDPVAGNDEQRMLVIKKLLDVDTGHQHAGVVFDDMHPNHIMISRPLSHRTNPASEPRVVYLGWKLARVNCKTANYKPLVERLDRPVTPIDWYTSDNVEHLEGWVPSEYIEDEQKFMDWLEANFGGENAHKYCRMSELDQFDSEISDSDESDAPADD